MAVITSLCDVIADVVDVNGRMHAVHTPVFKLLGDHFEAFRRDTLHQCEIDSPTSNFTPTRVYNENMSTLVTTCLRAK